MRREALRKRRQELGLTQEALAERLGVATTTYRGWERGVYSPLVGFRPRLARALGVSMAELAWMLDGTGERPEVADGLAVPEWLGHLAAVEQGAAAIWTFEPMVVPGLLQIETYAAAVERTYSIPLSETDIEHRVATRLARQAVLDRFPNPLRLSAVIDESVLTRVAGDGEIMADQLTHLADQAATPNIDLRILRMDPADFSPSFGAFSLYTDATASRPYLAMVRDFVGPHFLDRAADVAPHLHLAEHLDAVASSPEQSIDLLRRVVKERYT